MIGFVRYGDVENWVDALREPPRRAVSQIVEADFARGGEHDFARVLMPALVRVHVGDNQPDADSKRFENRRVALAVARGEIVVGGEDVDAPTGRGENGGGKRGGERFAFSGVHFDNAPANEMGGGVQLPRIGREGEAARIIRRGERAIKLGGHENLGRQPRGEGAHGAEQPTQRVGHIAGQRRGIIRRV